MILTDEQQKKRNRDLEILADWLEFSPAAGMAGSEIWGWKSPEGLSFVAPVRAVWLVVG